MRALASVCALALLAACGAPEPAPAPAPPAGDASALYPGVDIEGIAACARANATEAERASLAAGGSEATSMMAELLGRPGTAECLAASGIDLSAIAG